MVHGLVRRRLPRGRAEREGRPLAGQGLEIARRTRYRPRVGRARRALGRIALASGHLPEAERCLDEALRTFEAIGARFEVGRTHIDLAELARVREGPPAAAAHAAKARALFQTLRVPRYVERAERLAG